MEHWSEHSEHSELHVQTERPEPHIERPETPIDPRPGVDLELQPESDPPNEDPELQEWPEHHPEPHLQTEPPEIHPQTEPWPEPGPEPADSGGGSETAPGQLLTEPPSSALTERLEDISARIQLVRQKLSQRLDSQMR
ncbi:hypothetical protein FJT64_002294 [Amphibalanus amphitrite]|uniref:Uncharacterized protein n=1 Tax=Amphibalanus amphitrite TaxID=1232801 RepID=A0A6A4WMU0_AMPAM|nr:hypothetical protein FJT64_002294 [Amphibalanus amphitrite]